MIGRISQKRNAKRSGFTLIELAIVLAVASVLFAGLWRLMATGNTQLRDQSSADQQRQVIDGVKAYFQTAEGQAWLSGHANGAKFSLPLPAAAGNCGVVPGLCDYLPAGFTTATTNAYGQTYAVGVTITKDATTSALLTYSFMVVTAGGDAIPDTSGGRVASMIGSDGGFVYSTAVCGASASWACGAYGSWQIDPNATYALAPASGHIASRTYSGMNASSLQPWLARVTVPGGATVSIAGGTAPDFNTLQANTYFSSSAILYGGDPTVSPLAYGGTIANLRALHLGRPTADNTSANAVLDIQSGCARSSINDNSCTNNVSITGGVAIDGLLTANILYAGQFIYNSSSDIRLKDNVTPISDVLDKFAQIKGYTFTMKDTKEKKLGVIAQEVEKVFPDIVHTQPGGEYKSVDYMGLIGPLVSAVNELRTQNETLKAQLDKQEQTIEALKAQSAKKKK